MRIKQGVCGFAALLASSTVLAGCGGEGGYENVFLYFINGYPGTADVSVIGPTGTVVNNAPFGARMAADGPCPPDDSCVPIEVNRELGSDWTYLLESMPQPANLDQDLFSMYPQETGTVILNRRTGESSIEAVLFRHIQTISSTCSLTMYNGLSVSNDWLPDGRNNYTIMPEFNFTPEFADYAPNPDRSFVTECGELPPTGPEHEGLQRDEILDEVAANPWFFPIECEDSEFQSALCFGWSRPGVDGWAEVRPEAEVFVMTSQTEYYDCIEDAIEIRQPESETGEPQPFPDENAQVQCPTEPLTWDDVQVNADAVTACRDGKVTTVERPLDPGEEILFYPEMPCEFSMRIRTQVQQVVFGPEGNDELGSHQDGALVTSDIDIPTGSQHFYVLLGRPVNPILWQWDSGDTFVDLEDFPYFNDQNERIGDYDSR